MNNNKDKNRVEIVCPWRFLGLTGLGLMGLSLKADWVRENEVRADGKKNSVDSILSFLPPLIVTMASIAFRAFN